MITTSTFGAMPPPRYSPGLHLARLRDAGQLGEIFEIRITRASVTGRFLELDVPQRGDYAAFKGWADMDIEQAWEILERVEPKQISVPDVSFPNPLGGGLQPRETDEERRAREARDQRFDEWVHRHLPKIWPTPHGPIGPLVGDDWWRNPISHPQCTWYTGTPPTMGTHYEAHNDGTLHPVRGPFGTQF